MIPPNEGHLLRIFVGESDRHEGRPLYDWIVRQAQEHGLAGATVLRGVEGFCAKSPVHKTSILRLAEDLPIIIEIVDTKDKIESFMPIIDDAIEEGLVTLEKVEIRIYRAGKKDEDE